MHAVILAAGVGQRLAETNGQRPKSLLKFDDISLLARHLHILRHYGINHVTVVTGFEAGQITAELERHGEGMAIHTRHNADFRTGSIVSLHAAGDVLSEGQPVLLMDADVLYDHGIIGRLINSPHENCFLLDRDFEPGEEPVKLCVRDGRLIDFRKRIDKNLRFDFQGESVGFFRLSPDMARTIAAACNDYLETNRQEEPYEEVLRDQLQATPDAFGYEDITGMPWIEIDFPEDVETAERRILPSITLP